MRSRLRNYVKWWPGRELNPRHADFQSAALPTELPGPEKCGIRQAAPPIVNSTFRINHLRGLPVYGAEPSMAFPSLINAMFGQRLRSTGLRCRPRTA